ncbi:MAG: DUF1801 domain-containing protein, partial [Chloroflexi bacterium]
METILQDHTPDVQAIVEGLRGLIRATVPDASEAAHAVWHSINFTHPQSGYFCGIFPRPQQVTLVFEFGVLLPDPDRLLEGAGKQTRNLRLAEGDEIPVEGVKALLLAALALPTSR